MIIGGRVCHVRDAHFDNFDTQTMAAWEPLPQ